MRIKYIRMCLLQVLNLVSIRLNILLISIKKDNNGDYRYFELHKIRIAYFYDKGDTVEVLRVNHTKQKPREY